MNKNLTASQLDPLQHDWVVWGKLDRWRRAAKGDNSKFQEAMRKAVTTMEAEFADKLKELNPKGSLEFSCGFEDYWHYDSPPVFVKYGLPFGPLDELSFILTQAPGCCGLAVITGVTARTTAAHPIAFAMADSLAKLLRYSMVIHTHHVDYHGELSEKNGYKRLETWVNKKSHHKLFLDSKVLYDGEDD